MAPSGKKALLILAVIYGGFIAIGMVLAALDDPRTNSSIVAPARPATVVQPTAPITAPPPAAPSAQLKLLASRGEIGEYGYNTVEGQVQNITEASMKNIEAVVTWHDSNGNFISSDTALIEYDPLLPGQTSPFEVLARANPAMKKYSVEFKSFFGGRIEMEDARKKR